ncbi:hypothetical protein [Lysobacter arvi]|uniref:Uncharacterized protein n=1 Tax=Lysobacter arvi TaxID=3038776 RepID=A0ABU1CE46_9GAMM|nr:hypothetical protein [Lysobacter arvi]MDR0183447.1 hypothetical protein [Lysobacter arvi]
MGKRTADASGPTDSSVIDSPEILMQEAFLDPGPPPPGFRWHREDAAAISVLVPDGWFVRSDIREGIAGLFVSLETIVGDAEFRTGLSVNYFPQFSQRYGLKPSEQGLLMTAQMHQQSSHEVLLSTTSSSAAGTRRPHPRIATRWPARISSVSSNTTTTATWPPRVSAMQKRCRCACAAA